MAVWVQVKAHRTAFFFTDMTEINFYQYNGHPNTVNKQLGEYTAMQGDLRQTFDVLRPTVTLRKQPRPTFNYCYIPSFGRYYFVERVSFEGNNAYEISLRVDVLKTYETHIMEATGRVSEADNPDPYISTRETVYNRKPNFEKVPFTETGLLNETGGIIMVTLKGTTEN
ncbi:MAG: major tail protein [Bacteriophage sp.]|nr:MAG: major tail protein [Bacteriophage sp.]